MPQRLVAGSSNGRTLGSGPSSLGSNPSPAASRTRCKTAGSFVLAGEGTARCRPLAATLGLRRAHSSSGLGHRPLTAAARVRIPYAPFAPLTMHAGCRSQRRKPADRLGVVRSHISCQPRPTRAHERAGAPVQRADDLPLCLVDDFPPGGSAIGFHPQRDREEAAATRSRDPTGERPDSGDPVRDGSASITSARRCRDAALGCRDAHKRQRGHHDDANDPCSVPGQASTSFAQLKRYTAASRRVPRGPY